MNEGLVKYEWNPISLEFVVYYKVQCLIFLTYVLKLRCKGLTSLIPFNEMCSIFEATQSLSSCVVL